MRRARRELTANNDVTTRTQETFSGESYEKKVLGRKMRSCAISRRLIFCSPWLQERDRENLNGKRFFSGLNGVNEEGMLIRFTALLNASLY